MNGYFSSTRSMILLIPCRNVTYQNDKPKCFAKENSCNKQESPADDTVNTSQSVQVVENVSTPKPFPNANESFADTKRFHEEQETKLSEKLIRYIFNFWQIVV